MEHVDDLGILDRDPAVQRWIFGTTYTPEETRARAERRIANWETKGGGDYRVRTADGELAGFAGFFPAAEPDAVAIGYALRPAFWGRGYATELAEVLTRTAAALGHRTIVATVLPENAASRRVLEKVGFVESGTAMHDPVALLYRYAGDAVR